ncbi:MAG: acetylxylan esterase [Bacteroidales bacterium]|nr:acetylxylan esterase [Bacteroidales bacterium]
MKKAFCILAATFLALTSIIAQPSKQFITVYAEPDHSDWIYSCGEKAVFTLYAVKENVRMPNAEISYSYGPEKLKAEKTGTVTTGKDGFARITVPGRKVPGFTTVNVSVTYNGKRYSSQTNIGFDPYRIEPTTSLPEDFESFWENAKEKAARVPMLTRVRYSQEESNDRVDVFYIRIQSYKAGNYVYGVLTVPKTEGRKPAILRLPGAAVRKFSGPDPLAYEGFVVLNIGVHGIPVDQDSEIYKQLENGAMSGYVLKGLENRDSYYYKRSYLGCVRAVDYLCSREDVDQTRIACYGGSQGGMLSIVTAALDKRISALFAYFPAFCDVTGYYYGRSGGWPHLFLDKSDPLIEQKVAVSKYYDVVNFARFLSQPGFYAWGFNDIVCCPSSTFSAYNVIKAPKTLCLARDTGHWLYPWQSEEALKWLKSQFNMQSE